MRRIQDHRKSARRWARIPKVVTNTFSKHAALQETEELWEVGLAHLGHQMWKKSQVEAAEPNRSQTPDRRNQGERAKSVWNPDPLESPFKKFLVPFYGTDTSSTSP